MEKQKVIGKGNQHTGSHWDKWLPYVLENIPVYGYTRVCAHIGVKRETLAQQICTWRQKGIEIPKIPRVDPDKVKVKRTEKKKRGKYSVPDGHIVNKDIRGIVYVYKKIDGVYKCQGRADGPTRIKAKGPSKRQIAKEEAHQRKLERMKRTAERLQAKQKERDKRNKEKQRLKTEREKKEEEERARKAASKKPPVFKPPKTPEKVCKTIVRDPNDYYTIRIDSKREIIVKKGVDKETAIKEYLNKLEKSKTALYKPSNAKMNKYR